MYDKMSKKESIECLSKIPGVGKKIAGIFWNIGISSVSDIKDQDPEIMYEKICAYKGDQVDRCVLYVCRCANYFASQDVHDPELLKWWNWKEARI